MSAVIAVAVGLCAAGVFFLLRGAGAWLLLRAARPDPPTIGPSPTTGAKTTEPELPDLLRALRKDGGVDGMADAPTLASLEPQSVSVDGMPSGAKARDLTLLAIQIHGLDQVQESLGDVARARAVLEVAHTIRGTLRAGDTCARLDGDGLLALLPGIDQEMAPGIAARMRHAVSSLMLVTHAGQEIQLGVLIGRASSPAAGNSFPELLGAARRDLERVRGRLLPADEIHRDPAERIRQAVPLIPN